jgi:L-ascorbate metabolism protein UlaG (beta-lactamase superfamily)
MNVLRVSVALWLLCAMAVFAQSTSPSPTGEIRLTYLGQAGYEITDGKTVVLVDPVLSMISLRRDTKPGGLDMAREISSILTPDTETIDAKIKRADYILITHGHYDHLLDAPYISNKTGAVIIGHETTANIASAYNVPSNKLLIVRGGEDFDFGVFSLRVIPSLTDAERRWEEALRQFDPEAMQSLLAEDDLSDGLQGCSARQSIVDPRLQSGCR